MTRRYFVARCRCFSIIDRLNAYTSKADSDCGEYLYSAGPLSASGSGPSGPIPTKLLVTHSPLKYEM